MLRNPAIRIALFYAVSLAFILLNVYFVVKRQSMVVNLLPLALVFVLLAIFSVDRIIHLVILLTPLSVPLSSLVSGLSFDMNLPTEPLLFGILLLFLLRLAAGDGFDRNILRHPVSILSFVFLGWILVTSLFSTMHLVSFKFLLAKTWFVAGIFLLGVKLLEDRKNYQKFIWLYVSSFLVVIAYTVARHTTYGLLNREAAHFVMTPFYNDHTSYGAVLALFIPLLVVLSFNSFSRRWFKWVARMVLAIFVFALILSYSRAAWLSLFVALVIWLLIRLKIRFRTLLISGVAFIALVLVFQKQLVMYLERNKDVSSSNLTEHLSSTSNITSDASNLERINRWSCALKMFRDRPLLGHGPGTYMFKYAPYQVTRERTIISTNSGDLGAAHSEYLGPLAESGFPGMVTVLLLFASVVYIAFRTMPRLKDPELKAYLMGATIGLFSYYIHGIMNNFLDTDKASVPVWGLTAMIVALDLYAAKPGTAALEAGEEKKHTTQGTFS